MPSPRPARSAGGRAAAFAVKPATPFAPYADLLREVDMVLVMTVEPGFGGQSFMADQMPKVREVREAVRRHGGEVWVQVDGGVGLDHRAVREAGADVFVAGSAVYGAESAAGAIDELRPSRSRTAAVSATASLLDRLGGRRVRRGPTSPRGSLREVLEGVELEDAGSRGGAGGRRAAGLHLHRVRVHRVQPRRVDLDGSRFATARSSTARRSR